MKRTALTLAILVALVSFNSCSKKENVTDLTTSIVGTYLGTVVDSLNGSSTIYQNETITVSKVDETHVHITGGNQTPLDASVSADVNGMVSLNIPSQTSILGTIRGWSYDPNSPNEHGFYSTVTHELYVYIQAGTNPIAYEVFVGVKQ